MEKTRHHQAPGFPMPETPMSKADIEAYFDSDEITCLRCGVRLMSLGSHLLNAHGMTPSEYRTLYGLPWRRGLIGLSTRAAFSRNSKRLLLETGDHLSRYRHLARTGRQRPKQPYAIEQDTRRILASGPKPLETAYPPDMFERILDLMAQGMTRSEALALPGMPSVSWLGEMLRDAERRRRYDETVEALPFNVQARMESLGERFAAEVEMRRKADGKTRSDKAIARELGVTSMSVHRTRMRRGIA